MEKKKKKTKKYFSIKANDILVNELQVGDLLIYHLFFSKF